MTSVTSPARSPSFLATVPAYVTGWAVTGGLVAVVLAATAASRGVGTTLLTALVCAAVVVVGDATELRFDHGNSSEYVTLLEVGVVATLLLVPAGYAPLVVCGAVVCSQLLLRRRPPIKVAFNAGQHAVSAAAAAAVLAPLQPPGAHVGPRAVLGTLAAMSAYALVNSVALGGLFARLDATTTLRVLRSRLNLMVSTLLGASVVGILAVGLWQANPVLVPLLASPVMALHLAYRGTARTETLLGEVRIERDRLDRVVAGASEGIVLLSADATVLVWNPAMEAITGRPAADATGRHAAEVLTGIDADGTPVDPTMPLDQSANATFEVELAGPGTTSVIVQLTHTVIEDPDEGVMGDVVLVRDLSRERAATSLKEDFVARVSHELRTPLSPIRGYAQLLLSKGDRIDDVQRATIMAEIVERTGHLERLIDDLLLVSRIANGPTDEVDEVHPERVELDRLARRVLEWFERDHRDREFRLHTGSVPHHAWCDPFRAGQILSNLLSNACKYSPGGTPVDLTVDRVGERIEVTVRDRGEGIPADQLETVFERFQRLEDPQRMRTGGIGLGLYISRHLADRMDGELTVRSTRGSGSTFTLALPVAPQPAGAAAGPSARAARRPQGLDRAAG